ncbi:MAG TPA: ABC transporter ATP-binding protein [Steroidobacteraceae bacterium]
MTASAQCILEARELEVRAGERVLARQLSLQVRGGQFIALLGRNGCGKTLTLHTLAGLRQPAGGGILLDAAPLASLRRTAIARRVGLLLQDLESGYPMSVLEAVLVGRHPHLPLWRWERAEDRAIARRCLARVGLAELAARTSDTLSGGEQRRVAMATLLAQDPALYLLDEPTNHLDPGQQNQMLELFRERCAAGCAVLASLHDPTLAARYADQVLLLYGDGRWSAGSAAQLLNGPSLSELYGTRIEEALVAGRRLFFTV